MSDYPILEFWGAAGTVTGSKYLINTGDKKLLIDCGLFQGEKDIRNRNWTGPPFDPKDIDAVILTHAHIDHSGYLPRLMKDGFSGPIYCTRATQDLCEILLPDSGYLQEKHADYANKKGFSKHSPALPLYTEEDAQNTLALFKPQAFRKPIKLAPGLKFEFLRAGHILGAAMVSLHINGRHLVFSGDMGRPNSPTMPNPDIVSDVDYLILESTYGDKIHSEDDPQEILMNIINPVAARGGNIIIPCFAVGRTQSLLYHLNALKKAARIPDIPIFLDSPMAINASEIFCRHPQDHKFKADQCRDIFNVATYTKTVEDSKALSANAFPKVILSASGMATGGRILHHLKANINDSRNAVIFAGFQARGTRGESLVNGAKNIRIHGHDFEVKANIYQLDMLSAHADKNEILGWLKGFSHPPNQCFITHGETESSFALKEHIQSELHWQVTVPTHGESVVLK